MRQISRFSALSACILTAAMMVEVAIGWRRAVDRLQRENDELRLYLAAVIRLLTSKGVIAPDEVRQFVDALDSEDGTPDGRFTGGMP